MMIPICIWIEIEILFLGWIGCGIWRGGAREVTKEREKSV